MLISKHIHSTSYHAELNGMIERFHRQIKVVLCVFANSIRWIELFPIVLLGLHSSFRKKILDILLHNWLKVLLWRCLVRWLFLQIRKIATLQVSLNVCMIICQNPRPHMNTIKQDIKEYLPKGCSSWTNVFSSNDTAEHSLTATGCRTLSCTFLYR